MSGIQLVGNTNNTTAAEVELNTKALRAVIRPNDYGSLGMYSIGGNSGTMAATLGANTDLFQFRWTSTTNLALIRTIQISAGNQNTAFTAGAGTFALYRAGAWTADGSGGTALTPASSKNQLRTSMGSSLVGSIRISSTAALTAGTRTLDTIALSSVSFGVTATAGNFFLPWVNLWDARAGEYPLILSPQATNFEGFVIQNVAIPATGTWTFSVRVTWEELAAY